LFPAHVVRYFPEYEELWRRLGAGEVGEVSTAVLTRKVAGPPPGSWFYDEEQSGGVAMDLMVHELDQVLWLFGPVRTVAAQWLDGDRRAARATLGHVGGVTSTVEANWGPPDTVFTTSYAVVGSRGRLHHETVGDIETLGDLGSLGAVDVADSRDPYLRQLADVLEHLRTGRPARVTAAEGVAAVALAERVLDQLPSAS
jgi:myo-inositol 2-dehydrogenase / D-chiro-inositol 1-dehydrogenase